MDDSDVSVLPDVHDVLHQKAHGRDAGPAAGTQKNRLAARFDELDDIGVESNGSHGQNDEELAEFFQRLINGIRDAESACDGRDDGSSDEAEDEHRENAGEFKGSGSDVASLLCLFCTVHAEEEGDRDDRQRPRQLDRDGFIQRLRSQVPHAVPGRGGCRNRRGIVDGRAGKDAEGFSGLRAEADCLSENRKENGGQDVEEKDDRDRLGHFGIIRVDNRSCGSNGRTSADGRTDADQRGNIRRNMHDFMQYEGNDEGNRNGAEDDGQRLPAGLQHDAEVHSETKENDRPLQYFLGNERDTRLQFRASFQENVEDHAGDDGNDGSADDRKFLAEKISRYGDRNADQKPIDVFLEKVHFTAFLTETFYHSTV